MSYILTNPSALSALQSLQQTQNNLTTVQNQVSTGLAVQNASQNASYWSIATQLGSDNGVIAAANSSLTQTQSVLTTASSAISSIITTIQSIQSTLTQAQNPGADLGNINTTLAQLGMQLEDAVKGASFNGINLLDGSTTTNTGSATLNFVAGFNATATGGTVNTISLTTLAVGSAGGMLGAYAGTGAVVAGASTSDLTALNVGTSATTSSANVTTAIATTMTALSSITNYAATLGSTLDRVNNAMNLNSQLSTNYQTGVAGLVDANMNTASTQLQALQTQEQLGIQALSIANQNSQMILKLFNG